ncbi:class I SAM-dependent methyltransferase [Nocardioides aurantiacus]|uniref:Methyltransferase family protein n=1 Tax=Nocardioides aurantiacus TaxID=86796 RepID=A0A3N2CXR2_9ACTN|nr:class I SAM-dependent methyltransferase [Nocardioides aurantiacus]ROR92330.1 methyltransferase family protein [Nocardioides aurantiacus]
MDAAAWDERYAAAPLVWSAGPNAFVERDLADLTPGTALDLGSGEGRNARWLASRGWHVTALDFSPVGLDKGRRLAAEHDPPLEVDWVVGDVLSAPLPGALDLVVVAYLQLPAAERRTTLRRAWDALAPGGTLHLVAHDATNLHEGTGGPQDARVLCTAADVLEDLADQDPEVVHAGRVTRTVAAPDGHGDAGTAYDALVHLRRR